MAEVSTEVHFDLDPNWDFRVHPFAALLLLVGVLVIGLAAVRAVKC